ncbi:MAG TPA: hypothetical protein VH643_16480 [Gemmataceae bacterium]|jgi:hypothetical protein
MATSISTRTSGPLNPTRQQLDELDALLKRMLELPVNQLEEADRTQAESEEVAEEPPPPAPVVQPQAMEPTAPPARPPISYMVVETASPRPLPPASGFEPQPSPLMPPQDADEEEPEPPISAAREPEVEEETEPEVWVPLCSTWKPSPQTWPPLADSWHQANSAAGMPDARQESIPREIVLSQPATPPAPPPVESVQRNTPTAEQTVGPSQDKSADKPAPPPAAPTSTEPRLSLTAEDAPAVMPRALLPLLWFNQGFDACMIPLGEIGRWLSGSRGRQMLGLAGLACLAAAAVIALSTGMAWTR